MIPTEPLSEEQQQRTKKLFRNSFGAALIVVEIILLVIGHGILDLLKRHHLYTGQLNGAMVMAPSLFCAYIFAMWQVRRAGLSREAKTVEIVQRAPMQPTLEQATRKTSEWHYPRGLGNFIAVGCALFVILFSIAVLLGGPPQPGYFYWPCLVLFVFGIGFGIYLPKMVVVHLDEQGISGPHVLWSRKCVEWSKIASCEITRYTAFTGVKSSGHFVFKDEAGWTLLSIAPDDLACLKPEQVDAIETEVRRRMSAS